MNSYQAELTAKTTIVNALINAGCIDGATLSDNEVHNAEAVMFWLQRPTLKGGQQQTYLTFESVGVYESELARADNEVVAWNFEGNIDLFTRLKLKDTSMIILIGDLSQALSNEGFEVEMSMDMIDDENNISHKPIAIRKIIF